MNVSASFLDKNKKTKTNLRIGFMVCIVVKYKVLHHLKGSSFHKGYCRLYNTCKMFKHTYIVLYSFYNWTFINMSTFYKSHFKITMQLHLQSNKDHIKRKPAMDIIYQYDNRTL